MIGFLSRSRLRSLLRRKDVLGNLLRWLRKLVPAALPADNAAVHPFDRQHRSGRPRIDTGGLIYADELATGHAHDQHNAGYYATAPSLFHGLIARWRQTLTGTGSQLEAYSLVDLGCGKGRVLMLASAYPFPSIAGIEINPALAALARRNLGVWMRLERACQNVSVVEGDVMTLALPSGPVVLFCFNSFESAILQALLARLVELAAMRTAPIDLLYVHPDFHHLIRQTPGMELLFDENISFSAEDAAADVFKVDFDRCCGYRLRGTHV